jgi:ParB/RepB/Spo0J family partition protein
MDVQLIRTDLIDPPEWNSRLPKVGPAAKQEEDELDELAADIKVRGLLQPIVVYRNGDRYTLEIGSRRWRAHQRAELPEILADVKDGKGSPEDNIAENVKRKNLSTYEVARCCLKLREMGKSSSEIAQIVGLSASKVRNACVTFAKLPAPVKTDWEQEHPAVNIEFLRSLCDDDEYPTDDDKLGAWIARKVAVEKALEAGQKKPPGRTDRHKHEANPREDEDDDGDAAKEPKIPVNQARLVDMLKVLDGKRLPEKLGATKTMVRAMFGYVIGDRPVPPRQILEVMAGKVSMPKAPKKPAKKGKRK